MRGSIGKNISPKLARNKAKIEYMSEGQPSPYEQAFGIELGQAHILRPTIGIFLTC